MKKLVQLMYSEMVDADKKAFAIMGKAIFGNDKDVELEFDRLSTKAITIENLLLSRVNQDKVKELLDKARNSKNINDYYDCFMICKEADADENKFKGWNLSLHLYTKSHEMSADEFWNIYEKYI